MKFESLVAARTDDPFWFPEGHDYWLETLDSEGKWRHLMNWVTKQTAISNARKIVEEGFHKCVRVTKRSRYPDYPVHSIVFYRELY